MGPAEETNAQLAGFRRSFHECLSPWGDALFELCDAVLCSPAPVGSVPSLSLEPVFRRSHGSLYKALSNSTRPLRRDSEDFQLDRQVQENKSRKSSEPPE
jgi:hypothetical protein